MSLINELFLNWKICILIFTFIATIIITNIKLPILPVSGFNFIICSLVVWFSSLCITLIGLHKLLQENKQIEFYSTKKTASSNEKLLEESSHFKSPSGVRKLTIDIDKYFITKWYSNISNNNDFTAESRLVIEDAITRLLEVQLSVNNKTLIHGSLNIFLKHLKEFRRTLKRKEKYDGAKIEELYRYSHSCAGSSKAQSYFLHQLTVNLLSHFINWELWNSLPCHVLVSIVARKLTAYILQLLSTPYILNYYILHIIASKSVKNQLELHKYNSICFSDSQDSLDATNSSTETKEEEAMPLHKITNQNISTNIESSVSNLKLTHLEKSDEEKNPNDFTIEKKTSPLIQPTDSSRVKSDPVKIYEPKGTTKTWNDSHDLQSVSFGHDPLDALELDDTPPSSVKTNNKSAIWDYTDKVNNTLIDSPSTGNTNTLFNEVRNITSMEGIKSSIKPISDATVHTFHNIKDLQETTVNTALHKIGDFQDEAAGVVEGLLDFGRAGLRKGLRLTGLQDNIENARMTMYQQNENKTSKKRVAKLTRSDSLEKTSSGDSTESVWVNPIQIDSPNFDGQILLEKPKKLEEEGMKTDNENLLVPSILMNLEVEHDSPDPEYEEAADLASTIAKLRSLLQQKSSESSMSTPALSPMPPDEFTQKVLESENVSDLDEVDGVMPTFYKFCAKTATGVIHNTLNTIKTALPGNTPDFDPSCEKWNFVQKNTTDSDFFNRMTKLLNERKAFCTIETAYEAIDTLQQSDDNLFSSQLQFDDELDDFEVKLPITKAIMDIICELIADTDSPFLHEPMVKAILLAFGSDVEKSIISQADKFMEHLSNNLFTIPEKTVHNTLYLDLDNYVEALLTSFPDYMKTIFGKKIIIKALKVFVTSLQVKKINEDILMQLFELFCLKLIDESTKISPPASA